MTKLSKLVNISGVPEGVSQPEYTVHAQACICAGVGSASHGCTTTYDILRFGLLKQPLVLELHAGGRVFLADCLLFHVVCRGPSLPSVGLME